MTLNCCIEGDLPAIEMISSTGILLAPGVTFTDRLQVRIPRINSISSTSKQQQKTVERRQGLALSCNDSNAAFGMDEGFQILLST